MYWGALVYLFCSGCMLLLRLGGCSLARGCRDP